MPGRLEILKSMGLAEIHLIFFFKSAFGKVYVSSQEDNPWQVVDNFFCFFFSFEITVRFLAYKHRSDAFKEPVDQLLGFWWRDEDVEKHSRM